MAKFYYQVKQYGKVLELLQQVTYNDIFYNLDSKVTLLKTYYELDLYDLAFSQMDSFKQYLNRKGIMAYHKQNYQNNLKYVKRLLNLNTYDKVRKKVLYDQITSEQTLTEKKWLLEKLEQLGYNPVTSPTA